MSEEIYSLLYILLTILKMVLVEKFCYNVGVVLADVVYYSFVPTGTIVLGKITSSSKAIGDFAAKHVIEKNADAVAENLFECLKYLD